MSDAKDPTIEQLATEVGLPCTSTPNMATVQLMASIGAVGLVGAASAAGWLELTLVDVVVLLGVTVVLPLALPGGWWWSLASIGACVSLLLGVGWVAAFLVVPWLVIAGAAVLTILRARSEERPGVVEVAPAVAALYAIVAGVALASSRLGVTLFGIGEPIVELTAVHYNYAGCAALVLATRALASSSRRWTRIAVAAVALTAVAPVVVAVGFVTRHAVAQVGGAVAMTVGVWCIAAVELRFAADRHRWLTPRILLGVSGVAIWIPMVLAVAWAAGQHWDFPALSIPAMERTHGLANSLAFVLCGLLAWRQIDRRTEQSDVGTEADGSIVRAPKDLRTGDHVRGAM